MFTSDCLGVENGHLTIGGVDTVELAHKFGTPLYVIDEATVRKNCRKFLTTMSSNYKDSKVIFASKALNCLEMCRVVTDEGLGLDVVSAGELYTAIKAGVNPSDIYFHGNNKTADEIDFAIKSDLGTFIADNSYELNTINKTANKYGKKQRVMLRIKPGIDAHTHDFIRTGQIDSKFGFALENGEAYEGVKTAIKYDNIELVGLHCHIGSQIFEDKPFVEAATVMLNFYKKIKDELNITLPELNLGGGFGIKYTENDDPTAYEVFMNDVAHTVNKYCDENGLAVPKIIIEPGRSIVGEAGITLYTVGGVKEIENVRNYVSVDGGMGDNPRYILYQSQYSVLNASKADEKCDYVATVAGKCCESGDVIQPDVAIKKPEVGDTLAVLSTGAYNYSMASNYNRIPRPCMVMIKDKQARVIIKRETYEDLIRNDI
ncbi:MAG: diaminopimelate decarboxylase [Acutalibacteraceae bacterium]|nr:diaminopimelate decarboxylase [Acutalibacteraceae bacterium]